MGRFFNYENPVFQFLNKLVDCVTLSLFWVIFSLPIFTIGTSTTALYYTVNKVVRQNRSHVWREFLVSFKANFKQSTIIWLCFMMLCMAMGVNAYFLYLFYQAKQLPIVFFIVILCFFALTILCGIYIFPYIARFQNCTKEVITNCLMICIGNLHWSILLLVLWAIAAYIFIAGFGFVVFMVVPTGYMYMSSLVLEKIFKKYMSPEDLKREQLVNEEEEV